MYLINALELKRLRGPSNMEQIEAEIKLMESELSTQLDNKTILSVILDPALRLPVILTCVIQGSQQLSGITSVNKFSLSYKIGLYRVFKPFFCLDCVLLCATL